MNHVVYYLFVFPLSKLPLWFTYRFADLFYLLLITVLPYRKKVITANLTKSFPEKSRRNIAELRRKFYRTFADMMIEGVKNLGISEKELKKRFRIENLELMQQLYDEGKSVLLVSGHFNNWEWMITGQNLFFPHQAVGIGMPLSSGFWDKKINALRQRFGMHVIHSKIVKDTFQAYERKDVRIATLVLSDQSPGDTLKSYWTTFLGQPTAIAFGAEQLANAYDHAVVLYIPKTEKHVSLLEEGIRKYPQGWLWSHKRWKRDLPEDPEALKREQHEKFNRLYRNR
jgi:KDO2-lipid IV(A) lauroyltransferase